MHEVLRMDIWRPIVIESKRAELDDLVLEFTLNRSQEIAQKAKANIVWLERMTGITEYRALAKILMFPTVKALPRKK